MKARAIVQELKDSPYVLEQRVNRDEVILRYGDRPSVILERWRAVDPAKLSSVNSHFLTRIAGRFYRFAGQANNRRIR